MRKELPVALAAGIVIGCQTAGLPPSSESASESLRTVIVPTHVQWTSTPLRLQRGERFRVEATGTVRLSFDLKDLATPAGAAAARQVDGVPIPGAAFGALIGRINSGTPFPIGGVSGGVVESPAEGRLFLGVNDDHVADNSGNFLVRIGPP